jgi:hypothetical protein
MLDPHVAMIEGWLAAEPQLSAIAILGRRTERFPGQFGKTAAEHRAAPPEGAADQGGRTAVDGGAEVRTVSYLTPIWTFHILRRESAWDESAHKKNDF